MTTERVFLLDYGAGNVQSIENALGKLGCNLEYIKSKDDFAMADVNLI
jgi:glutamine amidotransferase/cyclase